MTAKIGVISNLQSRRNKDAMRDLLELLQDHPQVKHLGFHEISELPDCLREMALAGVTHLVISGGDGTVQAVVSDLINDQPFARVPDLSLLPSGMTNVVARDMGLTGMPIPYLKQLIERIEAGHRGRPAKRSVLTLDLRDDGPPIHGFLLGALAFYQGTILGRRKVHSMGLHQGLGSNIGLALSALRVMWYGPGEKSGFVGERVAQTVDGEDVPPQDLFLMVATTLSQILPGIKPFWGDGNGRMNLTTVTYPPQRFTRAALPALRGKPRPWMEDAGWRSRRAETLECDLTSPLVFDGEFLETDGGPGFKLSVGPSLTFTCY